MILHARLNMYHLPPPKKKKAAPEQVPEDTSASENEEEPTPAARAPLEIIEVRNKHWPPVPTVTEYLYGPLMPTTTSREWHEVRMHFSGSIPHPLQEGLSLNGLSRAEGPDTLNLLSRSRILTGAAAWHAHGKSHPQEDEADEQEAEAIQLRQKRAKQVLPSAPALPTTGTPSTMLGDHFIPPTTSYVNPLDATRQAYEYHWRKHTTF